MSVEVVMGFTVRVPTLLLARARSVSGSGGCVYFGVVSRVAHGLLGARKLLARASGFANSLPDRPSCPGA